MCPQIFVVSIDKALICLMWKNCLLNFFFKHSSACHACCTLTWLRRHRVREDMNSDLWSDFLSGWLCWTFSDLLSVLTFQFWNYVVWWSIATNIPPTVDRYPANIWHLPYHRYFNLVSTDTWSCRPTLNSVSATCRSIYRLISGSTWRPSISQ